LKGVSEEKQERIAWRRTAVNTFLIKGYSQADIARELQLSESTISRDVDYLEEQAAESIKTHLEKALPLTYRKCLEGMDLIIKEAYKILEKAEDNKEKISALSLIQGAYQTKLDMTTNGSLLNDAVRFVEQNKPKVLDNDVEGPAEVNPVV